MRIPLLGGLLALSFLVWGCPEEGSGGDDDDSATGDDDTGDDDTDVNPLTVERGWTTMVSLSQSSGSTTSGAKRLALGPGGVVYAGGQLYDQVGDDTENDAVIFALDADGEQRWTAAFDCEWEGLCDAGWARDEYLMAMVADDTHVTAAIHSQGEAMLLRFDTDDGALDPAWSVPLPGCNGVVTTAWDMALDAQGRLWVVGTGLRDVDPWDSFGWVWIVEPDGTVAAQRDLDASPGENYAWALELHGGGAWVGGMGVRAELTEAWIFDLGPDLQGDVLTTVQLA